MNKRKNPYSSKTVRERQAFQTKMHTIIFIILFIFGLVLVSIFESCSQPQPNPREIKGKYALFMPEQDSTGSRVLTYYCGSIAPLDSLTVLQVVDSVNAKHPDKDKLTIFFYVEKSSSQSYLTAIIDRLKDRVSVESENDVWIY